MAFDIFAVPIDHGRTINGGHIIVKQITGTAFARTRAFGSSTVLKQITHVSVVRDRTFGEANAVVWESGVYIAMNRDEFPFKVADFGNPSLLIDQADQAQLSSGTLKKRELGDNVVRSADIQDEAVSGRNLAANLVLASKITAGLGTQRVEIDQNGIAFILPSGSYGAYLPTDPAQDATFNGTADFGGGMSAGKFRLIGTDNWVHADSSFNLTKGVQPPSAPPSVSTSWDADTTVPTSSDFRYNLHYTTTGGVGGASTAYWYAQNFNRVVEVLTSALTVENRAYEGTSIQADYGTYNIFGVCQLGSHVYVLFKTNTQIIIRKLLNSNLTKVSDFVITSSIGSANLNAYFGLGEDGTDLYVAYKRQSDNVMRWSRFNTSGVHQATVTTDLTGSASDHVRGLEVRDDGSGTRIWMQASSIYSFNTSGVHQTDEDFPLAYDSAGGVTWDGTQFRTIGGSAIWKYTAFTWTSASSSTYWVAYSWYDSDATGGNHESTVSDVSQITHKKRSLLKVTSLTPPDNGGTDDPDSVRIYANRGNTMPTGGAPTRFSGYLQTTGSAGQIYFTLTSVDFTGSPPENPGTNDFPTTGPAELLADSGSGVIDGAGNISWQTSGFVELVPLQGIYLAETTSFRSFWELDSHGIHEDGPQRWSTNPSDVWEYVNGGTTNNLDVGFSSVVKINNGALPVTIAQEAHVTSSVSGTAFATASFTPTINTDYLIHVVNTHASNAAVVSSITQAGMGSFSSVASVQTGAATMRTSVWKARCTAATAGALTVNFGASQESCIAFVYKVTGDTNSVSTFVFESQTGTSTGADVTLTWSGDVKNKTLLSCAGQKGSGTWKSSSANEAIEERLSYGGDNLATFAALNTEKLYGNPLTMTTGGSGSNALAVVGIALSPASETPSGAATVTGFADSGEKLEGRTLRIHNVSDNSGFTETESSVILANNSGSSSAGNRILCPGDSDFTLLPHDGVIMFYDQGVKAWLLAATEKPTVPVDPFTEVLKASDQQFTGISQTSVTGMTFDMDASSVYEIYGVHRWQISSGTRQFIWRFTYTAITAGEYARGRYTGTTTADAINDLATLGTTTQWPSTNAAESVSGNSSVGSASFFHFTVANTTGSANTVQLTCALDSTTGSPTLTYKQGSYFRYRKLI